VQPVRIKLYGLFSVTRRGYLLQLATAGLCLLALLLLRVFLPPLPNLTGAAHERPWNVAFFLWFLQNLHWVVLVLALLFALEAFIVLRKFARAEASQRPNPPATPPRT